VVRVGRAIFAVVSEVRLSRGSCDFVLRSGLIFRR
jgi:hypothetical protein